jgi:hypothetical protein
VSYTKRLPLIPGIVTDQDGSIRAQGGDVAAFLVLELKGGWIKGLDQREFNEVPYKGQLIKFAIEESEACCWYEVVEVNFATGATNTGDIVLRLAVDSGNGTGLSAAATRYLER